jgi:hypothetical protein
MDMFGGPELTFEWSPTLVEGSESDGETMLHYDINPMGEMEYEYPEDDNDNDSACYKPDANTDKDDTTAEEDNTNSEEDCSDRECIIYPSKPKRKQRREKLNSLHCYVAHTSAVAVVASASMMAEGAAAVNSSSSRSIVAANAAILACVVGGTVAVLGNLLSGLAKTMTSRPQHDEVHEDAPLRVPWFKHFCGLFCFASIVRLGIGFSTVDSVSTTMNSSDLWLPDDNLYRVVCVIALSLISGCFLGLRHPLQSALLCGL